MEDKPSVSTVSRRHGGHRERIFTEPVMEVLLEQLGQHYYRIRDHLEKPQSVVTEIANYINAKIPGLQLLPMQVYGRMINLQNSLRRYWESRDLGDIKKKPRYYDHLCKVFGTDYNAAAPVMDGEEFINGADELDNGSPHHITVELPEFFDGSTLSGAQYTTTSEGAVGDAVPTTTFRTTTGNGREDMWTPQLTTVLLQATEECIEMLRSRPDKYKAWKIIAAAVNAHCAAAPMSVYQIKVKVKRMLAAIRKYERQAARGQLFVVKPFYCDTLKTLFKKELRPYQRSQQSTVLEGVECFSARRPTSALSVSMQSYMRKTSSMLEETLQVQKETRDEIKDYHSKILEQFKTFNDTYRMVALNMMSNNNKRARLQDDNEYEEVEELMDDEQSDLEEGVVEQEDYDDIHVTNTVSHDLM